MEMTRPGTGKSSVSAPFRAHVTTVENKVIERINVRKRNLEVEVIKASPKVVRKSLVELVTHVKSKVTKPQIVGKTIKITINDQHGGRQTGKKQVWELRTVQTKAEVNSYSWQ